MRHSAKFGGDRSYRYRDIATFRFSKYRPSATNPTLQQNPFRFLWDITDMIPIPSADIVIHDSNVLFN